jgi:hypothetical protein
MSLGSIPLGKKYRIVISIYTAYAHQLNTNLSSGYLHTIRMFSELPLQHGLLNQ